MASTSKEKKCDGTKLLCTNSGDQHQYGVNELPYSCIITIDCTAYISLSIVRKEKYRCDLDNSRSHRYSVEDDIACFTMYSHRGVVAMV